jgi:hypothetical protein
MQVKAVKTFTNKVHGVQPSGLVRTGIVLTVPDRIAMQWIRTGLVVEHRAFGDAPNPFRPTQLEPDDNKNLGDAPDHKDDDPYENTEEKDPGNDEEDDAGDPPSKTARRTGGKAIRSSALRPVRRSRKKI